MTTTSVIGSMNSQAVNLMNLTQTTGKADSASFKDFLNTGRQQLSDNTKTDIKSNATAKEENTKPEGDNPVKETVKTTVKETKKVETRQTTDEDIDNVNNAIEEVAESIEEEFDVTAEDILSALETLGLTVVALLDTEKMPALITELTGSGDTLSLATDENLFAKLNEITELIENAKEALVQTENIDAEEFETALKDAETVKTPMTDIIPETEETEDVKLEDKITVTVSKESTYSKAANEVVREVNIQSTEKTEDKPVSITENLKNGSKNTDSQSENGETFSFNLLTKTVEAMNENEEGITYSSIDVENVINQLTEAIKIDISPEISEINLRLHPESLGNVSVKVVANHEGVLTAEFTAQNESVKAIIESQAVVLKEALEAKGVTVEAVEVLVQSHEFERNLDGERQNGSQNEASSRRRGLRRINLSEDTPAEVLSEEDNLVKEMMAQNGNTVDYSA